MSYATEVPKRDDLMWPTLRALDGLGGSASIRELDDRLWTDMELPGAALEVMHGDGPRTELSYRSADGGVDGTGVLRFNLLSFHVSFQCKRYSGPVGPASVRDFRGALAGRSDKGLLITTGRFTREAEREADREGAMAIDLIDGGELCNLLRERRLGVVTETVERVERGFFEQI